MVETRNQCDTAQATRSRGSERGSSTFREQLVTHLPALRARARHLCRDRVTAEDLVQDTVVRALRFEWSFEPGSNLRAWLLQILFSVVVSHGRHRQREWRALLTLMADDSVRPRQLMAPGMSSLSPPVQRALASLPRKFSEVVRLVDLEERPYKDAASHAGVPVGTVMSRLFRGRRMLAELLADTETRLHETSTSAAA